MQHAKHAKQQLINKQLASYVSLQLNEIQKLFHHSSDAKRFKQLILYSFLLDLYKFAVFINSKCFSLTVVVRAISFLAFNAERVTRMELNILVPKRFLLLVFTSVSIEKARSAIALE